MNEWKPKTESESEVYSFDSQAFLDDLKIRINELLWSLMPGNTTLEEMDSLAAEIYDSIVTLSNVSRKRGENK